MTDCKHNKRIICKQEACEHCGFDPEEAKRRRAWVRSKTFPGIARAMALQWAGVVEKEKNHV